MTVMQELILFSFLSGFTIFLGGIAAAIFEMVTNQNIKSRVIHAVMAFGGGILIAAIGFVLVPPAMEAFGLVKLGFIFIGGAISFQVVLDILEKKGGSVAQLLAMLMDYIPESISLGALFVHNHSMGILLAIFIGLQNFPEAFNAYGDLRKTMAKKKVLLFLFSLSFTGLIAVLLGLKFLSNSPNIIAAIMAFAGGGIMFLIFQDIAPSSKVEKSARPAVWSTVGFFIGMIAQKVVGG